MATVLSVHVSERQGEKKPPVDAFVLREDYGIKEDAHAGSGRQVAWLLWKASSACAANSPPSRLA